MVTKPDKKKKKFTRDSLATALMLLPSTLFLAVCSIYPFIWIFRYVCYDYNLSLIHI